MLQDIRFAIRSLLHRKTFSAVSLAMLALGIGANTAIFSLVYNVLLRPLPFPEAGLLVKISGGHVGETRYSNISPPDFVDFDRQSNAFEAMGILTSASESTLTGMGSPERIMIGRVSEGFFRVLHPGLSAGRTFDRDDDRPDSPLTAVLTDGLFRRRFGSDETIVGRQIRLGGRPVTVIGILSPDFIHPEADAMGQPEAYLPFQLNVQEESRSARYIRAIGRLKPEMTMIEAQARLSTIAMRLEQQYPNDNKDERAFVTPLLDSIVGSTRPAFLVLAGSVAVVLLIACVNIANLLLASGVQRRREMAVRAALGATSGRLIRQLVTESFVLATAGGLAGLLIAQWGVRSLVHLAAGSLPRVEAIGVNWMVLVFAIVLSFATTIVFGLVPAIWLARGDTLPALRVGAAGEGTGPRMAWFRRSLVAGEVALSMTLLLVAGLLVRSFWRLSHVDPGFRAEHVLSMSVSVPTAAYPEGDQIPFHREMTARVAALPGVVSAGSTNILPLAGNYSCDGFQVDVRPKPEGQIPCAEARSVTPDYFRTMGVRLMNGRFFTDRDTEASRHVVILNEAMARQYWRGEDPVGQTMTYASRGQGDSRLIVGVVASVRHFGLDQRETPEFYTPHAQQPSYHTMHLVVRANGDPLLLTGAIREIVQSLDKDVPISEVRTLDDVVTTSIAGPWLRTALLGAFAILALVLAVGGLYGVIAYAVGQRTREIGIRMALGAQAHQVVASAMRDGLLPGLIGVAVGLLGALLSGRLVASLLFGITPTDAATFLTLPLLLLLVALLASYVPARRATRIDPVSALRSE